MFEKKEQRAEIEKEFVLFCAFSSISAYDGPFVLNVIMNWLGEGL